jgi:hypothetical protein
MLHFPRGRRTRTYSVTLPALINAPEGSSAGNAYFSVSPAGANFVPGWNQFEGGVSGNYLGFWFETLVEEVAPGNYLMIGVSAGGVVDTEHSEKIEIRGDGRISYCIVDSASGVLDDCFRGRPTMATCDSRQQTLMLTRQ